MPPVSGAGPSLSLLFWALRGVPVLPPGWVLFPALHDPCLGFPLHFAKAHLLGAAEKRLTGTQVLEPRMPDSLCDPSLVLSRRV